MPRVCIFTLLMEFPAKDEMYLYGYGMSLHAGESVGICVYSYRRGLRSCLSLRWGKFDGLKSEISNGCESHAFFMSITEFLYTIKIWSSI